MKILNKEKLMTQKVILEKLAYYARIYLDPNIMECNIGWDEYLKNYFISLKGQVAKLRHSAGQRIIKYPANWREAIKERWLPAWLKRKWPVKYKAYDALTIFPDFFREHPVPRGMKQMNYYFSFFDSKDEE